MSSTDAKSPSHHEPLIECAAQWRVRQDNGLTPVEQKELAEWLAADARHAEIFQQMDATWDIFDRAADLPQEKVLIAEPAPRAAAWYARKSAFAALAVAASLVMVFATVYWQPSEPEFVQVASADAGNFKRVNLPDGSVVRLNSRSEIAVEYSANRRSVKLLRGEAHFTVAQNRQRPFVVQAGDVAVRAVGTAFNVAMNEHALEVLVTEGKVAVEDRALGRSMLNASANASEEPILAAGQKLSVSLEAQRAVSVVNIAPALTDAALTWQEKRLEFQGATLSEIVLQFNRYNEHQLRVRDAELAMQRFAGSFRADDPEAFVEMIATRPGVVVEERDGQTLLRLAR